MYSHALKPLRNLSNDMVCRHGKDDLGGETNRGLCNKIKILNSIRWRDYIVPKL